MKLMFLLPMFFIASCISNPEYISSVEQKESTKAEERHKGFAKGVNARSGSNIGRDYPNNQFHF